MTLTFEDASYSKSYSFRTEALILNILPEKVVSLGNVIVVAELNLDDEEVNVGFEWHRKDWEEGPDGISTRWAYAEINEGMIEGYIRNLTTGAQTYKFRPFYTSNEGNSYYGNWKFFDSGDFSYFEPTVHTYAALAVTDYTAEVRGYAMQGTDNVESQGFMYWENTPSSSSRRKANGIPDGAKIVEAQGHVMKATLSNLDYDTEYSFVAFIKTANGQTFYGEQQSFRTTFDPDGIKSLTPTLSEGEGEWFDLSGRKIVNGKSSNGKLPRGINIIRCADGTSKKVLIK